MKPAAQRELLDAHAGLGELAREVAIAYREWQRLAAARTDQETNAAARTAERENLAWQVNELKRSGCSLASGTACRPSRPGSRTPRA